MYTHPIAPRWLLGLIGPMFAFGSIGAIAQTAPSPPTVQISFNPTSIQSGGTSTVTILLGNTNATAAILTQTLNDALPPGLTVSGGVAGSCGGGATATNSGTISYAVQSSILSGGCSITASVTAKSTNGATYYTNTIAAGALQTTLGSNVAAAASTLTVRASVAVPNVVGLTQAAAVSSLQAAGLTVVVVPSAQVSATVQPGRVISTVPAAGAAAAFGSSVQLVVSGGPGSAANTPLSGVPGLTSEQESVARGLEKTCSVLAGAFVAGTTLTPAQRDLLTTCTAIISDYGSGNNLAGLKQTLNAISGRQATAAQQTPMQFSAGQISNIGSRINELRAGARGFSAAGLDLGLPGGMESAFYSILDLARGALGGAAGDDSRELFGDRLGFFLTGTLRRGSQSTTGAEEGFDFRNDGLTSGFDYRITDALVVGLAGGWGKSTSSFDEDEGRLDSKHTAVSLYGSYFNDFFHIDWLAGFGHNSDALSRQIEFQSTSTGVDCGNGTCLTDTTGSTGSREYSFSSTAGMDFHWDAFAFGPTVTLDYKQVHVNGFGESGPSGLDLQFGDLTGDSLLLRSGGYLSYAYKSRWAVIVPQVQARFVHEFKNDERAQSVEFAADTLPGAADRAFLVFTDRPDRNYFDWNASLLFQFPHGISGFINYGSIAGLQNISTRTLNIGLRIESRLR
jgi:outer membrane lipase/esterase